MITLTEKDAIRKAICAPSSMPDSFLPKKLKPVRAVYFKEPVDHFLAHKTYYVYEFEGFFIVGENGIGYKYNG